MIILKRGSKNKKKVSKRKASPKVKKTIRKASPKAKKKLLGKTSTNKRTKFSSSLKTKKVKKPTKVKAPSKVSKEMKKLINAREKLWSKRLGVILSDATARQLLVELGGENTLQIIKNFYGSLSDEDIAKKLKLKISDVRATLNKLHSVGLVDYIRKKDSETGWYSYSWSLNKEKMNKWIEDEVEGSGIKINNGEEMYFCPSCGSDSLIHFNEATECEFRCPMCNKSLEFLDEMKASEFFELKRKL